MTAPVNVAILGCGPAGLLAAHAVLLAGHEPRIYSIKKKSPMAGTQYLHESIPQLTSKEPDGFVTYIKRGTQQGYAQKVYGSADAHVSWNLFQEGEHEIWNMSNMYEQLWDNFEDSISDYEIGPGTIPEILKQYPLVISSIPAPKICNDLGHCFRNQTIWVVEDAIDEEVLDCKGNVIIYDGEPGVHWYRTSKIFDKMATETTLEGMSDKGWMYGHKPIYTDCDCHPELFRVGRFGRWKKGVLSHHAFWNAINVIDNTIGRKAVALF